ncbi:hypothetical protein BU15DRAFT_78265 [Melanogaster broomeanus]|nr:hypothetical protein BU15DRAFT_78265 [Melanogaster broomeanus]
MVICFKNPLPLPSPRPALIGTRFKTGPSSTRISLDNGLMGCKHPKAKNVAGVRVEEKRCEDEERTLSRKRKKASQEEEEKAFFGAHEEVQKKAAEATRRDGRGRRLRPVYGCPRPSNYVIVFVAQGLVSLAYYPPGW